MGTLLGIFTGSSKWLYIALVVCAVGFVGASALSISLFVDKEVLQETNEKQEKSITKQASDIKDLQNTLVEKRGLIEAQNTRIKQMEVVRQRMRQKPKRKKHSFKRGTIV